MAADTPSSASTSVADSSQAQAELEAALAADGAIETPTPAPATKGSRARGVWQSMNPDIAVILDIAGAWFESDDPLVSGAHDPARDGFNLQQLELSMGASVDPYFRFDSNLVFGLFGVELEEAYGTTLALPAGFQVRLGQFLHRFGRINNTHPHSWAFANQMFMLGRYFGSEGGRGLGVEVSNLLPLPWYVEIGTAIQNADGAANARSFYGGNDQGIDGLEDFLYTPTLKQFFPLSDAWSLIWGLSAAYGPNGTGRDNRTSIYGTDLYLKWRPIDRAGVDATYLAFQAEALTRYRQVAGDLLRDHGGYLYGLWRVSKRWAWALRYEYGSPTRNDAGTIVADDLDPSWTDARHKTSANVSFWTSEFARFRVQVDNDMPTWRNTTDWSVIGAVEFLVGAHGAHTF